MHEGENTGKLLADNNAMISPLAPNSKDIKDVGFGNAGIKQEPEPDQ